MSRVRIGVSGWSYDGWQGDFYPEDLPKRRRLEYVGRSFDTVEVNGSFYSLLSPKTFRSYHQETPDDFRFAVKGSRFITHNRRLREARLPLANFLASGLLVLDHKLDVILWQLPDRHRVRPERFRAFLELLPHDTEEAAELARQHDERVSEPVTEAPANRRLRHAMEIRNPDDLTTEVVDMLRDEGVALVVSHAGDWPLAEELTAGFVYVRLHGAPETYADGYADADLERWAARIECWRSGEEPRDPQRITDRAPPRRKGRDVYVFLDNDSQGHAPHDALRLRSLLNGGGRPRE